MNKIKKWMKNNWYYLFIVPAIFYGIYKIAKFAVIMFSTDNGGPDVTRQERNKDDKLRKIEKEKEEERIKIKEEANKKKKELSSGEKDPADIFNEELGK